MTFTYTDSYLFETTGAADAVILKSEFGPTPGPSSGSSLGGDDDTGIDSIYWAFASDYESAGNTFDTFISSCCNICGTKNDANEWTHPSGASNVQCDTIQARMAPSQQMYECTFYSRSTDSSSSILAHVQPTSAMSAPIAGIDARVTSSLEFLPAPAPPPVPPSIPDGFVVCQHGVNMVCTDVCPYCNDYDNYGDVSSDGYCDDVPSPGNDCTDCGSRCCGVNGAGVVSCSFAQLSLTTCDCYGAVEDELVPIGGNAAQNRMFEVNLALPPPSPKPPPPPFGLCTYGTDHDTTLSSGTNCSSTGTTTTSASCSLLLDGDTSNPSASQPFELINSLSSSITINFPQPLDVNHMSLFHGVAASSPSKFRRVKIQFFDASGTYLTTNNVYSVPSSGQLPLKDQIQAATKVVIQVTTPPPSAPYTASYTLSEVRVANRCSMTPPSPPLSICEEGSIDMASEVFSCYASSLATGSHCSNAYDGVHDGLNSFFTGHGTDLHRSWVASSVGSATLRLVFTHTISFNYINIWQRLYHGFNDQLISVSIKLFGNNDEVIEAGLYPTIALDVATSQTTAEGESFVSRILLWRGVGGVHKMEIMLLTSNDVYDVGIAEVEIGTRCSVESPPPPPSTPTDGTIVMPSSTPSSASATAPAQTSVVVLNGLLDGTVIASANLVYLNKETCSSYCSALSPGSVFNLYSSSSVSKPSTWTGCTCFDSTTTTLRSNTSFFQYGQSVYISGLSLATYATMVPSAASYTPVLDGTLVQFTGILTASSSFKTIVHFSTGGSQSATFKNVLAVTTHYTSSSSYPICKPCIDVSSSGVRVRISTNGWTESATVYVMIMNNHNYDVEVDFHNRALIAKVVDGANGDEFHGSKNLIFAGEFGSIDPMAAYAAKTVGGVATDNTASVYYSTFRYTDVVGSHEVASFAFAPSHPLKNDIRFVPGFTPPPLSQSSLFYSSKFSTQASFSSGSACFDGSNGLVVSADSSALWRFTSSLGLTVCSNVLAFTQTQMFPTFAVFGTSLSFNMFSYTYRVGANIEGTDFDSGADGILLQNQKTHACLSVSPNYELTMYKNGSRISRSSADFSGISTDSKLSIGSNPFLEGAVRGLVGCMSSVRVWARVLSDAEVATVASAAALSA